MVGALLYLRAVSLRNLILARARRLRNPRYLAGAAAAAAYFYYFLFRRFGGRGLSRGMALDPMFVGASVGVLVLLLGWIVFAWVIPSSRPALRFTPAEIDFLFQAPIRRRSLVLFSLASSQVRILLQALILGLLLSRQNFSAETAIFRVAGCWLLLGMAELHRTGANLTFARLAERGANVAAARALAIAVLAVFLGAVALSVGRTWRGPEAADLATGPALFAYLNGQLAGGTASWLLWPFRAAAGPLLAVGARAFLAALPAALLLAAAHFLWVMRLEVSFEEASLGAAEKRSAQDRPGAPAGRPPPPPRLRREPFTLRPTGRPETAFLWKNLLSIGSVLNWSFLRFAVPFLVVFVILLQPLRARHASGGAIAPALVLALCGVAGFYSIFLGPQLVRLDLRRDLAHADLLKSYPLPGWQVVLGELLAPAAILSVILWALLALAAWALGALPSADPAGGPDRLFLAGCAATVAPFFCTLQLLVPNTAVLLLPAWYRTTGRIRGGGIENFGQRMLFAIGQLLGILIALLPAAITAPLLIFATQWLIGLWPAALLATAAVLVIIAGEIWCGVWWLGQRFERLDLSAEVSP